MHAARLVIVLFVILALIVVYSPQAREQALKAWGNIRVTMIEATNSLYLAVQNLISSTPSKDGTNEPVPSRGGNFERIVTMSSPSFVF